MNRILLFIFLVSLACVAYGQSVNLVYDKSSPQINYAAGVLEKSLVKHGYSLEKGTTGYTVSLLIKKDLGDEAFQVVPGTKSIVINGGSGSGFDIWKLCHYRRIR